MLYDLLIRPLLFGLDPERAHNLVLALLSSTPFPTLLRAFGPAASDPFELWGLRFRNRLGLAAGFDKNAVALRGWHAMGFGFVEVGTVTRHPQEGNPRPRIFRCREARALINRLGFPSDGADAVALRLEAYRKDSPRADFPIGANIGKSRATPIEEAAADYLYSFERLYDVADFFVINVSSPNTPGLRSLQQPEQLRRILDALKDADRRRGGRRPILVKAAPDIDEAELAGILDAVGQAGLDGIVLTNTTIDHGAVRIREAGGLSGAPLRARSTALVRAAHEMTGGKLPIVGVGGVFDRRDYLDKLAAGASLVEIYTGLIYEGPRAVARILAP